MLSSHDISGECSEEELSFLKSYGAGQVVENSGNKQLYDLGESFEPDSVDPETFLVKGIPNHS
jgi:hypothetical protein